MLRACQISLPPYLYISPCLSCRLIPFYSQISLRGAVILLKTQFLIVESLFFPFSFLDVGFSLQNENLLISSIGDRNRRVCACCRAGLSSRCRKRQSLARPGAREEYQAQPTLSPKKEKNQGIHKKNMSSSNPSSIQFDPVTDLDPNTWYQISEQRVDVYTNRPFTSNLQVTDPDAGTVAVWPDNGDLWQFQPAATDDDDDDAQAQGRYSLRCSRTGIKKQLSVCYAADEISPGRTQPCLADSDGSERQKWEIASWGNETFRFVNLHNGSEYWLDVHQGNPPFLSDNIDTDIYQPAQRWLFSTISEVNDGGYSTVFTNVCAPPLFLEALTD